MINLDELRRHIESGHITDRKHPDADLYIYNYTAKTQYDRVWNQITLVCRGLILDSDGTIVARPFGKFFNLSDHPAETIPNEPFEVFEKFDGSLGILYFIGDEPAIATRGAFASPQAIRGTEILRREIAKTLSTDQREALRDPEVTHLFEIVYPENRIVVDYGGEEKLVHLATIDKRTGLDVPIRDLGFPRAPMLQWGDDLHNLAGNGTENAEGYVVRFRSGLRVKVKLAEYLRLHKLLTGISEKKIWEHLRDELGVEPLLERVPDEFNTWVREIVERLQRDYAAIESEALADFKTFPTRKETAEYILTRPHPKVLFSILTGKDYRRAIWNLIEPKFTRPFKGANDE
ncbi:MAG: RNA ligase [Bacteroidota bacterium]